MMLFGLSFLCSRSAIALNPLSHASAGMSQTSSDLLSKIEPRELGPATFSGRATGVAVFEKKPRIFYVGAAAGGVWKTENDGVSFVPLFQHEQSASIGCVAVSQRDPNLVWVGTGEATTYYNAERGSGIYKSVDGGKTWQCKGLRLSGSISRIVLDPRNESAVLAGALGDEWSPGGERGLYRSDDGGSTWRRILFVNNRTGVADVAMDPGNPQHQLVAMWEHQRTPGHNFVAGPGSGLFRTTDGGRRWSRVSGGFPTGVLGRIGVCYCRARPRVVYATVETCQGLQLYRSNDGGRVWSRARATVFDGQGRQTKEALMERPSAFSVVSIDPSDPERLYLGGVWIKRSEDGGQCFRPMPFAIHSDVHAWWIDPADSDHILLAGDGGVGESRDGGLTFRGFENLPLAQFYHVACDNRKPYWVYGGVQDSGCWGIPTQTRWNQVRNSDPVDLLDGDGFGVIPDPGNPNRLVAESQLGGLDLVDLLASGSRDLRPEDVKSGRLKCNWNAPILLSTRDGSLYFGSEEVHRSTDWGRTWRTFSPRLTSTESVVRAEPAGFDAGAERPFHTLTTLSESPLADGSFWAGSDDGRLLVSRGGDKTWVDASATLPDPVIGTWISGVRASSFAQGRAYVTCDGHRTGDYCAHVYVTEDYGATWRDISLGLPEEPCYAILEDSANPDLLFLGTNRSLFASLDRGRSWVRYAVGAWPTVPVYDLAIQPRERDLVVATHGRGIWVLPIAPLEELTQNRMAKDVYLGELSDMLFVGPSPSGAWILDDQHWVSQNRGGVQMWFYLKRPLPEVTLEVTLPDGKPIQGRSGFTNAVGQTYKPAPAGLTVWRWDPFDYPRSGDYLVTLTAGSDKLTRKLHVEDAK